MFFVDPEDTLKHYVLFIEAERDGGDFILNDKGKNVVSIVNAAAQRPLLLIQPNKILI